MAGPRVSIAVRIKLVKVGLQESGRTLVAAYWNWQDGPEQIRLGQDGASKW